MLFNCLIIKHPPTSFRALNELKVLLILWRNLIWFFGLDRWASYIFFLIATLFLHLLFKQSIKILFFCDRDLFIWIAELVLSFISLHRIIIIDWFLRIFCNWLLNLSLLSLFLVVLFILISSRFRFWYVLFKIWLQTDFFLLLNR